MRWRKQRQTRLSRHESQIAEEKEKILSGNVKESEKNKLKAYLESEAGKENIKDSIKRKNLFDLLIKNAKIIEEGSKTPKKPPKK